MFTYKITALYKLFVVPSEIKKTHNHLMF